MYSYQKAKPLYGFSAFKLAFTTVLLCIVTSCIDMTNNKLRQTVKNMMDKEITVPDEIKPYTGNKDYVIDKNRPHVYVYLFFPKSMYHMQYK